MYPSRCRRSPVTPAAAQYDHFRRPDEVHAECDIQRQWPGQGNISIRGLGAVGAATSSSHQAPFPNVALYLDDQSMQFPARNNDIYMIDLERVEVLEGPQGTLFGGGAQAGAIRYITNKPKLGGRAARRMRRTALPRAVTRIPCERSAQHAAGRRRACGPRGDLRSTAAATSTTWPTPSVIARYGGSRAESMANNGPVPVP